MSQRYDAKEYDKGRTGENIGYWVEEASRIAGLDEDSKVLDFGCGTGNYTLGFVQSEAPGFICGLEPDVQMISAARMKDAQRRVNWCIGVGEGIPFKKETFSCIFSSQVWHHLKDKEKAAAECCRVLRKNAPIVVRTISHDQWKEKTVTRFFPEVLQVELRRYPSEADYRRYFLEAGSKRVEFHRHTLEQYSTPDEYIEVAKKKLWSMFWHLTDEQIREGIAKLLEYRNAHPGEALRNDDLITLVVAWR